MCFALFVLFFLFVSFFCLFLSFCVCRIHGSPVLAGSSPAGWKPCGWGLWMPGCAKSCFNALHGFCFLGDFLMFSLTILRPFVGNMFVFVFFSKIEGKFYL